LDFIIGEKEMKKKIYPGKLNKRAKWHCGIYKIRIDFQFLSNCFKAIHHVKKKKYNTGIFPFQLLLQTHTDCNAECIICPHKDIRKKFPREKIDMELYKKIVLDYTNDKRPNAFVLSLQCEPFMDNKLFERISFFQKHNIPQMPCIISTNGTLLNKEMCHKILNSGIDILQISVNGLNKDDFEKINQGKNYGQLINNINYFLSQDLSNIGVHISFVKTAPFEKEINSAVKKWRKSGYDVVVYPVSNRGGALKEYSKYALKRKNLTLMRRIRIAVKKTLLRCCPFPFFQMAVLANGKAILCCHDWERKTIIGDLTKQTIHEIWNSDKLNEIRLKIISGRYDEIAACKECSVYKTYTRI
jgi:radical SAM protein with 4Fe4S-binding SPASM domain